jgi:hypothetical protein
MDIGDPNMANVKIVHKKYEMFAESFFNLIFFSAGYCQNQAENFNTWQFQSS